MQRAASTVRQVPRVVFSGIQPTGIPHLGNYVGALRQWVQLQSAEPDTKLIYSIVDLHAITMPQPPDQFRRHKKQALAALLAIGIDPDRSTLFFQSAVRLPSMFLTEYEVSDENLQVSAHSELMWILSCTASVGYLSRMTQWKVISQQALHWFSKISCAYHVYHIV